MSLSHKPNIFGLEPFLAVDLVKANYYLGRVDIPPDSEAGEAQALVAASRGQEPTLDKTLPWMLLMRGMFSYLYKDELAKAKKEQGRYLRPDFVPRPIAVKPHDWARAFNFVTTSYIKNEFFKKPDVIRRQVTDDGREVALVILVTSPGKGLDKSESYIRPGERRNTVRRLRRMEKHRENLAEMPDVQKYLASLLEPNVTG